MILTQDKTLFISAGHSFSDPGASAFGVTEADIVLEFRDLLAEYLRDQVVFGRDGERGHNLPLRQAVRMAAKHDVAVEFHCNAAGSLATGVETLSNPEEYPLGGRLCQAVATVLGIPNRGAKPEASGQHSRLAFISDGNGLIVELFFLSNKSDLSKFIAHRREVVKAIGDVLIEEVSDESYPL